MLPSSRSNSIGETVHSVRVRDWRGDCPCCYRCQAAKRLVSTCRARGGNGCPPEGTFGGPRSSKLFTISSRIASTAKSQTLQQSSCQPSRLRGVERMPRVGDLAASWPWSGHLHEDGVAHADAPSSTSGSIVAHAANTQLPLTTSRIRLATAAPLASQTALSAKSRLTERCRQPGARAAPATLIKKAGREPGLLQSDMRTGIGKDQK